jgi:hypothetical protein
MRRVQEMPQHVVLQTLLGIRTGDDAELHVLECAERLERPAGNRHVGEIAERLVAQSVRSIQVQAVLFDLPLGIAGPAFQLDPVGQRHLRFLDQRTLEGGEISWNGRRRGWRDGADH